MRFSSYVTRGRSGFGAVVGNGVVDIRLRFAPRFPTLMDVFREGALPEIKEALTGVRPDYPLTEVELLRPVLRPDKIICVDAGSADDGGELRTTPRFPSLYLRRPGALVGHGQPILRPRESRELVCEGEIGLVIGQPARRVVLDQALDVLAGFVLCNAGTVRGFLPRSWPALMPSKNFDASGSLGPWITTCDEIDATRPLELTTRINGELWRQASSAALPFSFAELICFISTFLTLEPGDVILTGMPFAAGERADPARLLKPGDLIETAVPGLGVLANPVADEP